MWKLFVISAICGFAGLANAEPDALPYPFKVPQPPVLSAEAFQLEVDVARQFDQTEILAYGSKYCPKISALYFKIFQRMIKANHLEKFVQANRPGMKLSTACFNLHPRGTGLGPDASTSTLITLPASMMYYSDSEDDIATAIGHEMGHILLGHAEASIVLSLGALFPDPGAANRAADMLLNAEIAADKLGTILVANAGYDPRAAIGSLWHGIQFYSDNFFEAHSPFVWWSSGSDAVHPSLGTRARAIKDTLAQIGYHQKVARTISPDFKSAKSELPSLESQLKESRK